MRGERCECEANRSGSELVAAVVLVKARAKVVITDNGTVMNRDKDKGLKLEQELKLE